MAVITHGAAIVFPSEIFNAKITMQAVIKEKCTMLHGVPTMFSAYLHEAESIPDIRSKIFLKGGIAAGSLVPRPLLLQVFDKFGMHELTNVYGKLSQPRNNSSFDLGTNIIDYRVPS